MYPSDKCYTGTLMGRDCLNGGYARIESLEFPVEAFKDFLSAERMPLPDFWQTKTGSTGGHIKPAPAVAPSVAPGIEGGGVDLSEGPKRLPADDYEIAPGLTVGSLRRYFDTVKPPLRHILPHVVEWNARPPERRTADALSRLIAMSAKKDRWGTGSDGEIAKTQPDAFNALLMDQSTGGKGNKPIRIYKVELDKENDAKK